MNTVFEMILVDTWFNFKNVNSYIFILMNIRKNRTSDSNLWILGTSLLRTRLMWVCRKQIAVELTHEGPCSGLITNRYSAARF